MLNIGGHDLPNDDLHEDLGDSESWLETSENALSYLLNNFNIKNNVYKNI